MKYVVVSDGAQEPGHGRLHISRWPQERCPAGWLLHAHPLPSMVSLEPGPSSGSSDASGAFIPAHVDPGGQPPHGSSLRPLAGGEAGASWTQAAKTPPKREGPLNKPRPGEPIVATTSQGCVGVKPVVRNPVSQCEPQRYP